ncbi:glycosyl hydrolase family 95 catalytic domain-containing protein [Niabella insulamsoli]|uniref:glycosyl hydrolase family 95 catalytic domain-containing protein n=1 Tax=Niabella insulamsoli TaxID=3144874 RepID=UPI0031FDA54F
MRFKRSKWHQKLVAVVTFGFLPGFFNVDAQVSHSLKFTQLAQKWDEAVPLGNGAIGALIWEKEGALRFSLDRSDLWDNRPIEGYSNSSFNLEWIRQHVDAGNYQPVLDYTEKFMANKTAPSKIPAGAIEFNIKDWGVKDVRLSTDSALCTVKWKSGITMQSFVHATKPVGWFRFEGLKHDLAIRFLPPAYESSKARETLHADDLALLGYEQGPVQQQQGEIIYEQKIWGGEKYYVVVRSKKLDDGTIEGYWTIVKKQPHETYQVPPVLEAGFSESFATHLVWWRNYWSKSSIELSDKLIEKQWYLEQYKFGSVARRGAAPISLQAVWTADNGRVPPWHGDYHNDLNTQLSYWPAYSGNHLEESMGFIDFQEKNKPAYYAHTKHFFQVSGLAMPGVMSLNGNPMGSWFQYTCSPTVSAWIGHHYYWQWRYGMDRKFLSERAYPWFKEVALFLENITSINHEGKRQLPLSASPEINNNRLDAWFKQNTNFDLALMRFTFEKAAEMALELGYKEEYKRWISVLKQFDFFALEPDNTLKIAPKLNYKESHRHFSHLLAIYPLGLIKWEDGPQSKDIIAKSLAKLDEIGPSAWCGYSYAWLANLKARAKDGRGAAKALEIFAKAFCSPNSFHLNGDQTKSGFSNLTARPFTLEGNFAFASGLQEMLLQSYAGFIEVMPAVPEAWTSISFKNLRAEGAFLVSAKKVDNKIIHLSVASEMGGVTQLKLPFRAYKIAKARNAKTKILPNGFLQLECEKGGFIELISKD